MALGKPIGDPLVISLVVAGGLCVPLTAVALLYAARDAAAARDYWRRMFDVRRLSLRGFLAALLIMPTLGLIAAAVDGLRSGQWPGFAHLHALVVRPLSLLSFLGAALVFGPLPEEMGWRGYALKPLQQAYGPPAAALLLGAIHAAWHLPLFFIDGNYQQSLGVLTPEFWRFMWSTVAFGVIAASLFNAMGESALAVILFHWSANLTGETFDLTPLASWYWNGLVAVLAVLLILATRGRLYFRPPA